MIDKIKIFIFHYHFFKNAGTSVDYILQKSFPGRWESREFDYEQSLVNVEVLKWIKEKDNIFCFSTHTYTGPIPSFEDALCIPVIFIRHPIDRIASVYEYERNQNADGYGPAMAKKLGFVEYVKQRNLIDKQVSNFHLHRLSAIAGIPPDVNRVLNFLSSLLFIGLVDEFKKSMLCLDSLTHKNSMGRLVSNLEYQNVSRDVFSELDIRLNLLRNQFGDDFYEYLNEVNSEDFVIYNYVKERLLNAAI